MTPTLIGVAVWLVVLFSVLSLVLPAWTTGRLAARDRRQLVSAVMTAWLVLLLARAVLPLGPVQSWLWVVAVVATAVGVAGGVLRWRALPWARPRPARGQGQPDRPGWTRWAVARSATWLVVAGVGTLVLLCVLVLR